MSNTELNEFDLGSEDDATSIVPPPDIVAFNELRSTSDLVRLYETKQLVIQPDFQRGIVWSNVSQSLFIDSLTKQLPIPSICISWDTKTNKRLVIDGLQRIYSVIKFFTEDDWRLARTDSLDKKLSGKKVSSIREDNPELVEIVENVVIPVTVIRCDYKNESHMDYLYQIFHRLNSGGVKLLPQEIRNCIYQGTFNGFLKNTVREDFWLKLRDIDKDKVDNSRLMNEELLLRFFAFFDELDSYNGRLTDFLNGYMFSKKDIGEDELNNKFTLIKECSTIILDKYLDKETLFSLGKSVFEGLLIGVAHNIDYLKNVTQSQFNDKVDSLMALQEFSFEELSEGVARKEKVQKRLNQSILVFNNNG